MLSVPSTTWRMLSENPPRVNIWRGLDGVYHRAAGYVGSFFQGPSSLLRRANRIAALEKRYSHQSDKALQALLAGLRDRFRCGRETGADRDRAFAIVREAAIRTLGLRPYQSQVACGLAIEFGCVAEMATGEGKTLAATLPAILAGWRNRGCHVITANEYLARRDAAWMAPVYRYCGVTVGWLENAMGPAARKQAYAADITYGTSQEIAADFLRDRLALGRIRGLPAALLAEMTGMRPGPVDSLVQRGLGCAIVDEADAVLVDEAVTPLIISGAGPNPAQADAYAAAARLAANLADQVDFQTDHRHREVSLTPA